MANSFEPKKFPIPLQPKAAPSEPEPEQSAIPAGGLKLPTPKPKRKQYSVYLDIEIMERVRSISKHRGLHISDVIETCIKYGLDQMEG